MFTIQQGGEVDGSVEGATDQDGDALGEDVSSKQWKNPVPLQQVNKNKHMSEYKLAFINIKAPI